MQPPEQAYPVQFSVEYPDRQLNRLTTAFRIIVAIPILVVLGAVDGGWEGGGWGHHGREVAAGAGGLLFFAPVRGLSFDLPADGFQFSNPLFLRAGRLLGFRMRALVRVFMSLKSGAGVWSSTTSPR